MEEKNKYGYDGSEEFRPLSPWAYFGYWLLFNIPIIGLICNLVFCFADGNRNRKNFARAMWVVALFVVILAVISYFVMRTAMTQEMLEAMKESMRTVLVRVQIIR